MPHCLQNQTLRRIDASHPLTTVVRQLATGSDGESAIHLFEIFAAILTVAVVNAYHLGRPDQGPFVSITRRRLLRWREGKQPLNFGQCPSEYYGHSRPAPQPIGGRNTFIPTPAMRIPHREFPTRKQLRGVRFAMRSYQGHTTRCPDRGTTSTGHRPANGQI